MSGLSRIAAAVAQESNSKDPMKDLDANLKDPKVGDKYPKGAKKK